MTKQSTRRRPKPRSAQRDPVDPCLQFMTSTTPAARQTITVGRFMTNIERNILSWSVLLINFDPRVFRSNSLPSRLILPRNQREALPPPNDFAVFGAELEETTSGVGRVVDHFEHLFAIFRRSVGGFEIPIEVGLLEWAERFVND